MLLQKDLIRTFLISGGEVYCKEDVEEGAKVESSLPTVGIDTHIGAKMCMY